MATINVLNYTAFSCLGKEEAIICSIPTITGLKTLYGNITRVFNFPTALPETIYYYTIDSNKKEIVGLSANSQSAYISTVKTLIKEISEIGKYCVCKYFGENFGIKIRSTLAQSARIADRYLPIGVVGKGQFETGIYYLARIENYTMSSRNDPTKYRVILSDPQPLVKSPVELSCDEESMQSMIRCNRNHDTADCDEDEISSIINEVHKMNTMDLKDLFTEYL